MLRRTADGGMPVAKGRWLLGNVFDYERDRIGFLRDRAARLGDVFRYDARTIVVNHPDLIHRVLAETNAAFTARTPMVDRASRLSENLDFWMTGRRSGLRGMNPRTVSSCLDVLHSSIAREFDALSRRDVELVEGTERLCGRVIVDVVLGDDAEDAYEPAAETAAAVLAVSRQTSLSPWSRRRLQERAVAMEAEFTRFLAGIVAARRRRPSRPDASDMLAVLLGTDDLPDELITTIVRITIIGGHGTPGASLAWIVRELMLQPDVRERIEAEVAGLPGPVATGGLDRLSYTTAFVKEILRAHTPTWLLTRDVAEPVRLGAWPVEAGQRIVLSPYLVHHDERWWTEPDRVLPQRWLAAERPHPPRAYLPFGTGPRKCLGSQVGMSLLILATARLAGSFRVEGPDWSSVQPCPDVLLTPGPATVRLDPVTTAVA